MHAVSALPLIDLQVIMDLCDDAGEETYTRLTVMFADEARERVGAMEGALRAKDRGQLGFDAHALKSAAGYVGAIAMREMALELERGAESLAVGELGMRLAALRGLIEPTLHSLDMAAAERLEHRAA